MMLFTEQYSLNIIQHANFIEYGRKGPRREKSSAAADPFADELFRSQSSSSNTLDG